MKTTKLSTHLALLLVVPLLGLAFFGLRSAHEKWVVYQEYAALEKNSAVLQQIGHTVHELQKERGRSSGFLNSKGRLFASELKQQRTAADAELAKLGTLLERFEAERFGATFGKKLSSAQAQLRDLADKRRGIDALEVEAPVSLAYFTQTIASLLDVVVAMSHLSKDADIAEGIQCYVNFLQAKENAGIERAVLSGVFAVDAFTPDTLHRFNRIAGIQETYLRVFDSFATPEQQRFMAEKVSGAVIDKVAELRAIAAEKAATGKFGVAATVWFDAATARIDLMKQVEDRLAADYTARAEQILHTAWRQFLVFAVIVVGLIAGTVVASALFVRSISNRLRQIAGRLMDGASQLTEAANQMAAASEQEATGVSQQAASLEETSASLEEITSMTKRNASAAGEAKTLSGETRAAADGGSANMTAMSAAMAALKNSSGNVAKIVKSIDEIAFQTNILALNAAVEAARAGAAGAGFSVVAEEVRALAQRSAEAAKETAAKIDESVRNSDQGVAISQRIAEQFQEIVVKARKVDGLVGEIATASREQLQGIEQVNSAIVQIDGVSQSEAATAEQIAAQAEQLNAQATDLNQAVGQLMAIVGGRREHDHLGMPGPVLPGGRRTLDARPTSSAPRQRTAAAPRLHAAAR